jgi:hypothetical protein
MRHPEWIAAEHHRLHLVEDWPESPHKTAALAAIQSSLQSLAHTTTGETYAPCEICLNRRKAPVAILTENRKSN